MIVVIEVTNSNGAGIRAGDSVAVNRDHLPAGVLLGHVVGYKKDNRTSSRLVETMQAAE